MKIFLSGVAVLGLLVTTSCKRDTLDEIGDGQGSGLASVSPPKAKVKYQGKDLELEMNLLELLVQEEGKEVELRKFSSKDAQAADKAVFKAGTKVIGVKTTWCGKNVLANPIGNSDCVANGVAYETIAKTVDFQDEKTPAAHSLCSNVPLEKIKVDGVDKIVPKKSGFHILVKGVNSLFANLCKTDENGKILQASGGVSAADAASSTDSPDDASVSVGGCVVGDDCDGTGDSTGATTPASSVTLGFATNNQVIVKMGEGNLALAEMTLNTEHAELQAMKPCTGEMTLEGLSSGTKVTRTGDLVFHQTEKDRIAFRAIGFDAFHVGQDVNLQLSKITCVKDGKPVSIILPDNGSYTFLNIR